MERYEMGSHWAILNSCTRWMVIIPTIVPMISTIVRIYLHKMKRWSELYHHYDEGMIIWGFPKIGVHPVIIHFWLGFSLTSTIQLFGGPPWPWKPPYDGPARGPARASGGRTGSHDRGGLSKKSRWSVGKKHADDLGQLMGIAGDELGFLLDIFIGHLLDIFVGSIDGDGRGTPFRYSRAGKTAGTRGVGHWENHWTKVGLIFQLATFNLPEGRWYGTYRHTNFGYFIKNRQDIIWYGEIYDLCTCLEMSTVYVFFVIHVDHAR